MLNQQPPEKQVFSDASTIDGTLLDVHSIFDTIQGEGPFCGRAAVFIRLAGCNLQCPLCDTDYTQGREKRYVWDIFNEAAKYQRQLIVITGGEPFRQPIGKLIRYFLRGGYTIQIETNGSLKPSMEVSYTKDTSIKRGAFIVCSPKAGKVHDLIQENACCFKYVLHADSIDENDGLPILALNHPARPRIARPHYIDRSKIYVQPVDVRDPVENKRHLQAAIDSCRKFDYTLQLQIHKIIGME